MRWAGHVARIGVVDECIKDIGGKARRKDQWKGNDIGGWTILKWVLER
jgi:hypothetical protein